MRKKVLKIMGVFLVIMIGFTVISRMIDSVNVARITAKKTSIGKINHTIEQDAVVSYNREMPVFAESGLIVQSVNVDVGQRVKKGDVLFTFSVDKLKEKRSELRREIKKMDLQIASIKSQQSTSAKMYQQTLNVAKNELARAKADGEKTVSQAWKAYNQAKADYKAYMKNEETESFDQSIAKELEKSAESAKEAYDSAVHENKNNIARAKEQVNSASIREAKDTNLEQMAIDKMILQEQLQKIQKFIKNSGEVKSKKEGTITGVNLTVGEMSPEGAALLMSDHSKGTKVEFLVNEEEMKYFSLNSQIKMSGMKEDGTIEEREDFKISAITPQQDSMDLYSVVIRMKDEVYLPGSMVQVKIISSSEEYSNCVPISALYEESENRFYVYTVGKASTMFGETEAAKKVEVKIQDKNNEVAALEEQIDDEVIVETDKDLSNGDRVRRME